MKVLQAFFCIKEGKSYKKGDQYTGSRTDLADLGYVEKQVTPKGEDKNGAPKKRTTKKK